MPKLLIQEGGQQSVFELFDDEATIGRGAANAVQVADNHSSKYHAVIRRLHGRAKLVDLESKNGTRVNGEFKNQKWLEHGDVVTIGALTISYDGSDAFVAPAPSVHVAAAPAISLSPSMAVQAAAPAPAPVPTVSRGGGGRSRRPRDDDDDDRDRGGRVPARRGTNNAAVAMLVGLGVVGVIAIFFLLMSGKSGDAQVLQVAIKMYKQGRQTEAIQYLKVHGDPSNEDSYESVKEKIKEWEDIQISAPEDAKESIATKELNHIERDRIEQHKNGFSDEQLGRRLLKLIEDYPNTREVAALQNSKYEPYVKLRVLIEKAKSSK